MSAKWKTKFSEPIAHDIASMHHVTPIMMNKRRKSPKLKKEITRKDAYEYIKTNSNFQSQYFTVIH